MSLKKMKDICMVLSICMNIGMPACLAADLSIDEAVEMALAKNNDVKIANEEKMAAQANYEATKGANGVSISLGSSQSAERRCSSAGWQASYLRDNPDSN